MSNKCLYMDRGKGETIFCNSLTQNVYFAACARKYVLTKLLRLPIISELAATNKEDLLVKAGLDTKASVEELGGKLKEKIFSIFRRSLHVREVDAGSCNGCEWEVVALYNSPVHDLQRFGIDCCCLSTSRRLSACYGTSDKEYGNCVKKAYHCTPDPRMVIALGACACSGVSSVIATPQKWNR